MDSTSLCGSRSGASVQGESLVMTNDGPFMCLTNMGEGDCLFQALSQQLGMPPLALRRAAVAYMREHLEVFGAQLIELGRSMELAGEIPFLPDEEIPATVLNVLNLPWTWGGAECIAALASHLQRRIIVYQENGPSIPFTPNTLVSEVPLRLMHRFGRRASQRAHYEGVVSDAISQDSISPPGSGTDVAS